MKTEKLNQLTEMSYPKPRKITVIGQQTMVRMVGGKSEKVQVPVVWYGQLPSDMRPDRPCKENGCSSLRLHGSSRCKDHVKQYN